MMHLFVKICLLIDKTPFKAVLGQFTLMISFIWEKKNKLIKVKKHEIVSLYVLSQDSPCCSCKPGFPMLFV